MPFPSTLTCLAAALLAASHVLAEAIHDTQPTPTIHPAAQMLTPNTDAQRHDLDHGNDLDNHLDNHLELRQATAYNLAATTAPTQVPAVTTFWMNQQVGTTVTWGPIVYTQLFPKVPDQLPSPGVGSIGLGNLVKQEKREAEAAPTPAAIAEPPPASLPPAEPLVLELPEVGVTQWIQPVTQVTELVVSTVVPTIRVGVSGTIAGTANATVADVSMATAVPTDVALDRVLP